MKLPPNWSKMSLADKTRKDILTPRDPDYVKVSGVFCQEAGIPTTNIVQVIYLFYSIKFVHKSTRTK